MPRPRPTHLPPPVAQNEITSDPVLLAAEPACIGVSEGDRYPDDIRAEGRRLLAHIMFHRSAPPKHTYGETNPQTISGLHRALLFEGERVRRDPVTWLRDLPPAGRLRAAACLANLAEPLVPAAAVEAGRLLAVRAFPEYEVKLVSPAQAHSTGLAARILPLFASAGTPWARYGVGPRSVHDVTRWLTSYPTFIITTPGREGGWNLAGVLFTALSPGIDAPMADDLLTMDAWCTRGAPRTVLYHAITVDPAMGQKGLAIGLLMAARSMLETATCVSDHLTVTPGFDWLNVLERVVADCGPEHPLWAVLGQHVRMASPAAVELVGTSAARMRSFCERILHFRGELFDPAVSPGSEIHLAAGLVASGVAAGIWNKRGATTRPCLSQCGFHLSQGAVLERVRVRSTRGEPASIGLRFHFRYAGEVERAVARRQYESAARRVAASGHEGFAWEPLMHGFRGAL